MAGKIQHIIHNCKEATHLSLQKEERALSIKETFQLRLHLMYCDACKQFIKQSAIINKAMLQIKDAILQHPPQKLSQEVKDNIQQQLNDLP